MDSETLQLPSWEKGFDLHYFEDPIHDTNHYPKPDCDVWKHKISGVTMNTMHVIFASLLLTACTGTSEKEMDTSPATNTEEPDTGEVGTEDPDTGEVDTEEPDTEEPDTEEPDTEEPDTGDTGPQAVAFNSLSITGVTLEAEKINQFRATKYGVPYSDWLSTSWSPSDIPVGSNGFQFEADCGGDSTFDWGVFEVWHDNPTAHSGELTYIEQSEAAAQIPFYDAVISKLNGCDGGERSAIISAGSMDNIPTGNRIVLDISGVGRVEVEEVIRSTGSFNASSDPNAMVWPISGNITVQGLCGTPAANSAYGWATMLPWYSNGDERMATILMLSDSEQELARISLYGAVLTTMGTCADHIQSVELSVGSIEVQ